MRLELGFRQRGGPDDDAGRLLELAPPATVPPAPQPISVRGSSRSCTSERSHFAMPGAGAGGEDEGEVAGRRPSAGRRPVGRLGGGLDRVEALR